MNLGKNLFYILNFRWHVKSQQICNLNINMFIQNSYDVYIKACLRLSIKHFNERLDLVVDVLIRYLGY